MRMPFLQPENNRLQTWLQTNVEDEFQYKVQLVPVSELIQ
jgi:hypothetical protein